MIRLPERLQHLSHFPIVAGQLAMLRQELAHLANVSPHATLVRTWAAYGMGAMRYLPLSLMPILRGSPVNAGIAVGWHRAPFDLPLPPELEFAGGRFLMGRLIHAIKEYDDLSWTGDDTEIHAIGHLAACALLSTNMARKVDLIAAVPSSRGTNTVPFRIARDVAFLTNIRYAPATAISFSRQISQMKEIDDYWVKREALDHAMDADPEIVRGRSILIVDDVCQSGTTLHEAARACLDGGAGWVAVMAMSKTFEFQRIPAHSPAPHDTPNGWV